MKKELALVFTLMSTSFLFAQVGINTENPQQLFHVDGKSSPTTINPITGAPSVTQQIDDVVITSNGYIGLGTINPTKKMEIQTGGTTTAPVTGFKLVDGNQGSSKVLMSDSNGVGTWNTPASIKSTVIGVYPSSVTSYTQTSGSGTVVSTNTYVELSTGKWVVSAGITLTNNSATTRTWLHSYLSSSNNGTRTRDGFTILGPALNSTSYAGALSNLSTDSSGLNFISGSSIIEVTSATPVRIYLTIERLGNWTYSTGALENYFYAVPIN